MNKLRNILLNLLTLIIAFLLNVSCSKNQEFNEKNFFTDENFIEKSLVKDIASSILFPSKADGGINENNKIVTKTVSSINEVKNTDNKVFLYIINYSGGGFVIMPADKRIQPILAYSVSNEFSYDESLIPDGLKFWLNDILFQISEIQNNNIKQSNEVRLAWEHVQQIITNNFNNTRIIEDPNECYEHVESYSVLPLLNTTWDQLRGFNDDLPYIVCNDLYFQVYAGCVPIAMAQVMKYHQYPSYYDWASMPSTYATATTASFIRDIHIAINNVYSDQPSYYCSGTSVSSTADMGLVLKTQFNYHDAIMADYDFSIVRSNLDSNKPVLLVGFDSDSYSGHMWVCDGYTSTKYFFDDCTGFSTLYFHMNWGWFGKYDAYYAYNNFNPGDYTFNDNKIMIYNITP